MHQAPMGPTQQPGAAAPALPLQALQTFMSEGLPLAAVAHSVHVDALSDPALRQNRQFQRFSEIELNELHHQIAAVGAMLRMQMGDPRAVMSLGINLAGFLQNRMAALAMVAHFPPAVMRHPDVQMLMALVDQSNRQVAANWPVLQSTLAATGAPAPGPLMVDTPRH